MFNSRGTDNFPKFPLWILGIWILGVLGSLGVTGVVIWAIVKLVLHFTS